MKCVYMIINLINNKKYIGSTSNFSRRKREHLWMLRNNKHKNNYLQLSFNKYGEENFVFIVLEQILDNYSIYELEQIYLDKYKTYEKEIGYNLTRNTNSPNNDSIKKKVYQYDLNENLIMCYNSLAEAADILKCNYSTISLAAKGKNNSAKRFIWFFEGEFNEELLKYRIKKVKNKTHSEETKKRMSINKLLTNNGIKVLQLDNNDNIIKEYSSIKEASKITGFKEDAISGICKGKYKKGRTGYKWKYKNEQK